MGETAERFDRWCVVEILGHQRFAGRVTEETHFGTALLRLDVPEVEKAGGRVVPAFTQFYGSGAIYRITPCSEEYARAAARAIGAEPVALYVPQLYPPKETQPALVSGEYEGDDGATEGDRW